MSAYALTTVIMTIIVVLGSLRRVPPALAEFLHSCQDVVREWQAMKALLGRTPNPDSTNTDHSSGGDK